tara:strand:- start:496 stop:669 length:174 start_codon:yes stop_codon:yes gene_type:complete
MLDMATAGPILGWKYIAITATVREFSFKHYLRESRGSNLIVLKMIASRRAGPIGVPK